MKMRETENGNIKLTLTLHEADVIASVLSYVRLNATENSEIVFNFLQSVEKLVEQSVSVAFEYNECEGHIINV